MSSNLRYQKSEILFVFRYFYRESYHLNNAWPLQVSTGLGTAEAPHFWQLHISCLWINCTVSRCIVLTEPLKSDSKSTESWSALFARMRLLLLQSYDTNLGRFEDHMRAERERRTEKGWNFCSYFLLQVSVWVCVCVSVCQYVCQSYLINISQ